MQPGITRGHLRTVAFCANEQYRWFLTPCFIKLHPCHRLRPSHLGWAAHNCCGGQVQGGFDTPLHYLGLVSCSLPARSIVWGCHRPPEWREKFSQPRLTVCHLKESKISLEWSPRAVWCFVASSSHCRAARHSLFASHGNIICAYLKTHVCENMSDVAHEMVYAQASSGCFLMFLSNSPVAK